MALAALYNVPSSINDMSWFSFTNADEHTKIAAAILSRYNVTVPTFVLDPIPLFDTGAWLTQHQALHNIMNGVLGVNSDDLTSVDFTDQAQLSEWIWLHAQEHYQAADILELK